MTSSSGSDNDATPNGLGPHDPIPEQEGNAVERLIERFGGIRPMAAKLDIPVTTVQGWKKRGAIPAQRHADLKAAAARHTITLTDAELEATLPRDEHGTTSETDSEAASPTIALPGPTPADQPSSATPPSAASTVSDSEAVQRDEPEPAPSASGDGTGTGPREEPAVAVTPPVDSQSASRSGSNAVAVIALLVGLAALGEPWWGPVVPGWPRQTVTITQTNPVPEVDPQLIVRFEQLADRVNELERRPGAAAPAAPPSAADQATLDAALKQLSERLDGLERATSDAARQAATASPTQAQPDPRIGQLSDKIAGLESTLSGLAGERGAADQLRSELDGLKSRLGTLATEIETRRDTATTAQALVLAAGQLRAALSLGQPFGAELKAVRALGISDPQVTQALDSVSALAEQGVPTQAVLTDRFLAQTSEIVRTDAKGNNADWLDQVAGTLSTLVTVRRQGGNVVGDSADAVVARTEAALRDGDLARAVAELSVLTGPATAITGPWLDDAKARLAANQAAEQLTSRAISLLSGSTEAGQ